jgi:hypothetical protein
MRKMIVCTIALLNVLLVSKGVALESANINFWGEMTNDLTLIHTVHRNSHDTLEFTGNGILTLNLRTINNNAVRIEASSDIILLYGAYGDLVRKLLPSSWSLSGTNGPVLFDLRKLYAGFFLPFVDIFAGRQIINYGVGTVFSPVDIFSSVNFFDVSFKRRGSDVLRLRVPFGPTAGAELTAGLTSTFNALTGAVKMFGTISGVDCALYGIFKEREHEASIGASCKGDYLIGICAEVIERISTDNEQSLFSGMIGADYSVHNEWLFDAEYLYNKNNGSDSAATGSLLNESVFTSQHAVFLSVLYKFNDLSNAGLSAISAVNDGYGLVTAQYSRNFLQNATAMLYVRYLYGNKSGLSNSADIYYGLRLTAGF